MRRARAAILKEIASSPEFDDDDMQGILDGGHNLLAIALFILKTALGEEAEKTLKPVKRWNDLVEVWRQNRSSVDEVKQSLSFLTPVEIIYPQETDGGASTFDDAILEVAQARNNNAQLTEETKANKAGYFKDLRESLDPQLVNLIEWKSNDGGKIKVRDLIALAWIPLSVIEDRLPLKKKFKPSDIYSSKAVCVSRFNELMENDGISIKAKGDIRELQDSGVKSALGMLRDLPRIFDLLYKQFPSAYNKVSPRFGGMSNVRIFEPNKTKSKDPKYLRTPERSKFYRLECEYEFPDAFILPLMWALRSLMEERDGKVIWRTDPEKFLNKNLDEVMTIYYSLIHMAGYDPQKVGKASGSYQLMAEAFKTRLPSK